MDLKVSAPGALVAGILSAIGASLCCAAVSLLAALGLGGAWSSRLTALQPLRPLWLTLAAGFFATAFYLLYRKEDASAAGNLRAAWRRRQRLIFWLSALGASAMVAFPWYAGLLS